MACLDGEGPKWQRQAAARLVRLFNSKNLFFDRHFQPIVAILREKLLDLNADPSAVGWPWDVPF